MARRHEQFLTLYPAEGRYRRELYGKHLEFFGAGLKFQQRLAHAANQSGKTTVGAYETACHATGRYPEWWTGRRFNCATDGWACGTNSETTRNLVQGKLLGPVSPAGAFVPGTGLIPGDAIADFSLRRSGLVGSVETVWVRHVTGKLSRITFKSYEQGRESFQGDAKHYIWNDEEPDALVFGEQLPRLVTTQGIVYITATALKGASEVVASFIDARDEAAQVKYSVSWGWDDVPHLDPETKRQLLAGMMPHEVGPRTRGEISAGVGAVYPISPEEIVCDTFLPPESWMRVYALDVGWNKWACVWFARNPAHGGLVIYDGYYQGQGEPASHAAAIRARGEWIPGVIDPAARGRSQVDGRQIFQMLVDLGLNLQPAVHAVDTGITEVWQAFVSGRLKVQRHLTDWFREFSRYHRDEKGHIVKAADHYMDATRYGWVSGRALLALKPKQLRENYRSSADLRGNPQAWMA